MSRSRLLPAVLAVPVLALTGCGVSDAGFQPGEAVSVNGESISVAEVDEVAASLCAVLETSPQQQGVVLTGSQVRMGAEQGMVFQIVGDQLLEAYDVALPATASDGEEQVRSSFAEADPDDLETALPAFTGLQHFNNVLAALGEDEVGPTADQQAVITAGVQRAQAWQADSEIRTNPAFDDFEIGDEQILSTRDEISVPASEFARQAAAAEAAPDFAASLPESQRCGG